MVSAVDTQTTKIKKKTSPLFKIRLNNQINKEKTQIRNIVTNFLENRIFIRFSILANNGADLFKFYKDEPTCYSTCQCRN